MIIIIVAFKLILDLKPSEFKWLTWYSTNFELIIELFDLLLTYYVIFNYLSL